MPEDNLIFKLGRLASYKIRQLGLIDSPVITEGTWKSIENLFQRENRYAKSSGIRPLKDNYERAIWAYYELLEAKTLTELNNLKNEVYRQIKTSEVKKNITIGR